MLEDLLNNQEPTNSILIIDSFKNEASGLLISFIKKILEKDNNVVKLYPTFKRNLRIFKQNLEYKRAIIDCFFIENLFKNDKNLINNCFNSISNEYKILHDENKSSRSYFVCDNLNIVVRSLHNNPFKLMQFVNCSNNKLSKINTVIMLAHQDSIEDVLLNHIKSVFQTIVFVDEKNAKHLNSNLVKYDLKIEHKNKRTFKIQSSNESIYLNENFEIKNIEKHKTLKNKSLNKEEDENEDIIKGLTFNLHISSNDLEAKKNLILPYEITGGQSKSQLSVTEHNKREDAKIYYAPDQRDDFDDEDPDEDLNF